MSSRSATLLVIFTVAIVAFCLASVFASMTGPISILPNKTNDSTILDNVSSFVENGNSGESYGYKSYDRSIFPNPNIYENNLNSSRNFFGNSSKLENLQNLYFSLNPYAKSTSINSNQQLRLLNKFQSEADENALDKKYGKPIINNYQRFHLKAKKKK